MTNCLILRGVPGSGKSTIAEQTGYAIVNRDSIRKLVTGSEEDFTAEAIVTKIQNTLFFELLKSGRDVVVDNTNIEWVYIQNFASVAKALNAKIEIRVIDIPVEEALRRNTERGRVGGREVPEHVIRNFHDRLQKTKGWTL